MLAFMFPVIWKILEWSLVAAAVLTYVEIGPGGDSLGAIVNSLKDILIDIDWSSLGHSIGGHIQNLAGNLWESFFNGTFGQGTDEVKACIDAAKDCQQHIMENTK